MARLKSKTWPKWAWWGLWLIGVVGSLAIIFLASFQIWMSTWKTYESKEGYVLRYPPGWVTKDLSGNLYYGREELLGISNFPGGPNSQDIVSINEHASIFVTRVSKSKDTNDLDNLVDKIVSVYSDNKGVQRSGNVLNGDKSISLTINLTLSKTPFEFLLIDHGKYFFEIKGYVDEQNLTGFGRSAYHYLVKQVVNSVRFK